MHHRKLIYQITIPIVLWSRSLFPTFSLNYSEGSSINTIEYRLLALVWFIFASYFFVANNTTPFCKPLRVIASLKTMNCLVKAWKSHTIGPYVFRDCTPKTKSHPCNGKMKKFVYCWNP